MPTSLIFIILFCAVAAAAALLAVRTADAFLPAPLGANYVKTAAPMISATAEIAI